jgi:hypothetical protein
MERMILVVTSKWHRWKGGWERKMTEQYATFEGYPALYDDVETYEAYVLFGATWTEMPITEFNHVATEISKSTFRPTFPRLPPLPAEAFKPR